MIKAFLWCFAERCGAQVVSLIVSIILARLLGPAAFGTIALIFCFTAVLYVFVNSGFGGALIQKKDADDLDFSSVFYFNVTAGAFLYLAIFFAAPFIAHFYEMPELTAMVRVLGIAIIFYSVQSVQQAHISRSMQFKQSFVASLVGTLGGAALGLIMAFCGCGVWSLVAMELFKEFMNAAALWLAVGWVPKWEFSFVRLGALFSFGWKLLASGLLDTIYNKLIGFVIGKKYTTEDLGLYQRGVSYPYFIITNINSPISRVIFPALSSRQNDKNEVRKLMAHAISVSTYILMPVMVGLAVCAEPFVLFLLGEQWLPCVPYMRVFCFTYAFYPIHTVNLNAINAMGRSDLFLTLEVIKKIVGFSAIGTAVFLAIRYDGSALWMAYSMIVVSICGQLINTFPNKKLMNYGYLQQLKDIMPQIVLSLFMGAVVYCVTFLKLPEYDFTIHNKVIRLNPLLMLTIQVFAGAVIYIAGSHIFHLSSYEFLKGKIMSVLPGSIAKLKHCCPGKIQQIKSPKRSG